MTMVTIGSSWRPPVLVSPEQYRSAKEAEHNERKSNAGDMARMLVDREITVEEVIEACKNPMDRLGVIELLDVAVDPVDIEEQGWDLTSDEVAQYSVIAGYLSNTLLYP